MDDGWQTMCYDCNTGNITNVTIKVKRNFQNFKKMEKCKLTAPCHAFKKWPASKWSWRGGCNFDRVFRGKP
jgi:hypothetical protein